MALFTKKELLERFERLSAAEKAEYYSKMDPYGAVMARLDRIASEIEKVDPKLALAIDKISDQIEAGYERGHHGDPQYEIPDHVRFTLPKNFYSLQIRDAEGEEIDTLSLRNESDSEERSDEDDASPVGTWITYLLKDLPTISKWAIETIDKKRKDYDAKEVYKEPWEFIILRGEDDELDKDMKKVSELKTEAEVSNWIKEIITKNFTQYYDANDNWEVMEPRGRDDYDA